MGDESRFCSQCGGAVPGTQPVHPAAPPKRMYRRLEGKKIAGVCAGMAEYFNSDVTLVRLLWVVGTFCTPVVPGVIAYILAWIILPVQPEPPRMPYAPPVENPAHS
ncbi:MAG: PspC domain-containing protein [Acidobacteria bacterium]|nr:PspC domain-containing protein [Acidobacteriota bacterium]